MSLRAWEERELRERRSLKAQGGRRDHARTDHRSMANGRFCESEMILAFNYLWYQWSDATNMKSTRGKIKVFFVLYFGDHISSQSLQSCIMKFRCIFREDCMKLFWETTYKVNHGRHYPRIVAHRSISARTWFQVQINVFPSIREPEHHVVSVILLPILLTTWIIPSHWCCLAVYKTVSIAN